MIMTKKKAQTMIEYSLLFVFVTAIIVIILTKYMGLLNNVGNNASTAVSASGDMTMEKYCQSKNKKYNPGSGKCE